jgi:hypothetical protein
MVTGTMACMIVGILSLLCILAGFIMVKKDVWTIECAIIHTVYQLLICSLFSWLFQMGTTYTVIIF